MSSRKLFGKRKHLNSILPIVGSGLLAAGALTASGFAISKVVNNYEESAEFTQSAKATLEIDPVAFYTDASQKADKELATKNTKIAAERLSAWLKYCSHSNYDVSWEVSEEPTYQIHGNVNQYISWLSFNINVEKVTSKLTSSDEKVTNDPFLSVFDNKGFNSNNKTLVYRWYIPGESSIAEADVKYTILPFEQIFTLPENAKDTDMSKTLTDKDGKPGVMLSIKDNNLLDEVYLDMKKAVDAEKDKNKEIAKDHQPRLYIVNNIEGLYAEANYHWTNYEADQANYAAIYKGTSYEDFAKRYEQYNSIGTKRSTTANPYIQYCHNHDSTTERYPNGSDVLNYLDQENPGTIAYSWMNKYIEKTISYKSSKYQEYMPDKITDVYGNDDASTKDDPNLKYFWYGFASTSDADTYFSSFYKYGMPATVSSPRFSGDITKVNAIDYFKKSFTTRLIEPKFVDSLFGGSNLVRNLSLGFLAFLVVLGIILAFLYRTTGVMSWICMMFMLSITGLIATLGSAAIGMSLLIGLFIMSIAGFIAAMSIGERIRRRLNSNEDPILIVNKGFKKSLWPLVDISVITLIFGVCFIYLAPIGLNQLGLALIAGAFMTFISMFLINGLLHLLLFNNNLMMSRLSFIGKGSNKANEALSQGSNLVPSSLDATRLEYGYYNRLSTKKIGIINKKAWIIIGILLAVLISGLVCFGIFGYKDQSLFHYAGLVSFEAKEGAIDIVSKACKDLDISYTWNGRIDGGWVYFNLASADKLSQLINAITTASGGSLVAGQSLFVQTLVGSTNADILSGALVSMIVASSAVTIYQGIRSNWTGFVPMIVGTIITGLLILGISSIGAITFDETAVLGLALVVVINSLISSNSISTINEAWARKESYSKEEFKFIVNTAYKNNMFFLIVIAIAYVLFITMFGITAPTGLGPVIGIMIIGLLVSILATPYLSSITLYYFLLIRNKALDARASRGKDKVVVNYDDVDEQEIDGINKFRKVRATSKPSQVKVTK